MTVKMPGPVAWMDGDHNLINANTHSVRYINLITTAQAEAYARAVRDEALDEAAKIVDNCHPKASHKGIASAIRALKREQS